MLTERKLVTVENPEGEPGFLGAGHIARPVIRNSFAQSDPFILLMDDVLDKKDDTPAGGPHPHAGFETATLVLEGGLGDGEHAMRAGDFQLMTAGSGIEHTETISRPGQLRILQLWLNLPRENRQALPRVQDLPLEHVPAVEKDGVHTRLYSGSLAGITAPVHNYVPLIIADITLQAGVTATQQLPANFNTFLYVLDGTVKIGSEEKILNRHQVGWLNLFANDAVTTLTLTAGIAGARLVLYAGKPLGEPIMVHGPFVADSSGEIVRLYREYRQGNMQHIADVAEAQKIRW